MAKVTEVIAYGSHDSHNVKNEKFVLEDGIWVLNYTADVSHRVDYMVDCFDEDGKKLGEYKIDSKNVTETKDLKIDTKSMFFRTNMIQYNLDFILVSGSSPWKQDEVYELTDLLNKTFGNSFESEPRELNSIDMRNLKSKFEICTIGNSLLIINKLEEIDFKKYNENYKKALIKYPEHKKQIDYLYNCNIGVMKK